MKEDAFTKAMNKIVSQAEAEREREIRDEKRAHFLGRVRSVFVFLFIATVLVVAFNFRDQLTGLLPSKKPDATAPGQTAAILNQAQQNAAARDAVVDQAAK